MTKQRLNGAQMGQQLFSVIFFFFYDLFTPQAKRLPCVHIGLP